MAITVKRFYNLMHNRERGQKLENLFITNFIVRDLQKAQQHRFGFNSKLFFFLFNFHET
jgi:hypothetical protein